MLWDGKKQQSNENLHSTTFTGLYLLVFHREYWGKTGPCQWWLSAENLLKDNTKKLNDCIVNKYKFGFETGH